MRCIFIFHKKFVKIVLHVLTYLSLIHPILYYSLERGLKNYNEYEVIHYFIHNNLYLSIKK